MQAASQQVRGAFSKESVIQTFNQTLTDRWNTLHDDSIEGKTLRHSYDTGGGKGAIHMVSAWASQNRLVLGPVKGDAKSNEITAIPQLLAVLELHGCIVTIDAMGTQKEIAQQIIAGGGESVLSLEGNQGKIHQDVKQLFEWTRKIHCKDITHEFHQTIDAAHGRVEICRHWLLDNVEHLMDAHLWVGLQRVGLVESERRLAGQAPTIEQRYYLVSLEGGVQRFAQAVRSHGVIENQVHWVLAVAFDEDASRVRKDHAPENFALIRPIALNLLQQDTSAKGGIKAKRLKAGWDNTAHAAWLPEYAFALGCHRHLPGHLGIFLVDVGLQPLFRNLGGAGNTS